MKSFRRNLLLATPELLDTNFCRAVILILEHQNEGAIGVVLNRPTDHYSVDVMPKWNQCLDSDPRLYWGGPVQEESLLALALSADPHGDASDETIFLIEVLNLNQELLDTANLLSTRLYSGYAGWSAGQLDTEISTGGWIVADSDDSDPFTEDPDALWGSILSRQTGFISTLSQYPDDPRMN